MKATTPMRWIAAACLGGLLLPVMTLAQHGQRRQIALAPPPSGQFVVDRAEMLTDDARQEINDLAASLLREHDIRLIVVTIHSMERHGRSFHAIELFAKELFAQWPILLDDAGRASTSRSILFLVSRYDRQARIELGGVLEEQFGQQPQRIMDGVILPHFRRDDYTQGILEGTRALDQMARGHGVAWSARYRAHLSPWVLGTVVASAVLIAFTVVSACRSGRAGWAIIMWLAVFGLLATVGRYLMELRHDDHWWGGGGRGWGRRSGWGRSGGGWGRSGGGGGWGRGGRGGGASGRW